MDQLEFKYKKIRGGIIRIDLYETFFQLLSKWVIAGAAKERMDVKFIDGTERNKKKITIPKSLPKVNGL